MAEGITGWRLHVGVIFPTPVPPRAVLEFYEAVPEGIDMTTVSLTIQQLSDNDMDEAITGMERAAKQLANFDVDVIYQSGVPPVVRRGLGFGDELADRLSQASGLPAITDMSSVIDAMRTANLKTLAMATPFEQFINDRLVQYLAAEKIEVTNNTALGIKRNVEIRRLPIPVEYTVARKTYLESPKKPDGIYIPCGGWGSIRNIELLEKDRHHRGDLDECHDLELDAARQGCRRDPRFRQIAGVSLKCGRQRCPQQIEDNGHGGTHEEPVCDDSGHDGFFSRNVLGPAGSIDAAACARHDRCRDTRAHAAASLDPAGQRKLREKKPSWPESSQTGSSCVPPCPSFKPLRATLFPHLRATPAICRNRGSRRQPYRAASSSRSSHSSR